MSSCLVSTLVCIVGLLGSAVAAGASGEPLQAQDDSRLAQAAWLSRQLHHPVEVAQILLSPEVATLENCTVRHVRRASTGATALSLRCPASRLPRLVLLADTGVPRAGTSAAFGSVSGREAASGECAIQSTAPASLNPAPSQHAAASPKIVRAGAALRADWRTAFIHAQFPVVALDSGAAGAEIRVRIPLTNRIIRARILSADAAAIVLAEPGSEAWVGSLGQKPKL